MIKEQSEGTILAADVDAVLLPDKRQGLPYLDQKILQARDEGLDDAALGGLVDHHVPRGSLIWRQATGRKHANPRKNLPWDGRRI